MGLFKKDYKIDASLSVDERVAYGSGNFALGFANTGMSVFMLFYFTNYVGLNAGIVGTILLVSRFLDGISDLFMGYVIDRTHTKNGKARPWILRASIPYALATVLLFAVPGGCSATVQYIWVFVTYNLLNTVLYTMCAVAYNSLTCLLTQNQYERGLLGTFSMFGLVAAQFIVNGFTLKMVHMFGDTKLSWTITFAIYAAVGLVCHLLCYKNTVERVSNVQNETKKEEKLSAWDSIKYLFKNKYWLMFAIMEIFICLMAGCFYGAVTYYATYILENAETQAVITNSMLVTQMIFMLLSFIFIRKFGKVGSVRIGSAIMITGFVLDIIFGGTQTGMIIGTAVCGIGNGIAASPINGICADTVEYGEWKFGVRSEGMAFAAVSTATKIGSGLATAIIGWALVWGGFDSSAAVQSARALLSIKVATLWLPLIFLAIVLIIAMFFDLEKIYGKIMDDLKERRTKNI